MLVHKMLPYKYPLPLKSPEEKLFVLLVGVVGIPAGKAYQIAMPTRANMISATSMASKLLHESRIQSALRFLERKHAQREFAFNDRIIIY